MPRTSSTPKQLSDVILGKMSEIIAGMKAENKSKNTINVYLGIINDFAEWSDADTSLTPDDINANTLMRFMTNMHYTASRKAQAKYALLWLIDFLIDEGYADIDDRRIRRRMKDIGTPKPENQPTVPTRLIQATLSDLEEQRKTSAYRDMLAMQLMCETWIRLGEACRITIADVTPGKSIAIRGKGAIEEKDRKRISAHVRVSPRTWEMIRFYMDRWRRPAEGESPFTRYEDLPCKRDFPLLTTGKGQAISEQSLRKAIVRHMKRSAIEHDIRIHWKEVGPHAIRRTMATEAYKSGRMNLREIQLKLRHQSITTTARYLRIKPEEIE